jgi:hypothetical protein
MQAGRLVRDLGWKGVGTVRSTGSDMTLAVLSDMDRSRDAAQEGLR